MAFIFLYIYIRIINFEYVEIVKLNLEAKLSVSRRENFQCDFDHLKISETEP